MLLSPRRQPSAYFMETGSGGGGTVCARVVERPAGAVSVIPVEMLTPGAPCVFDR